MLWVIGIILIVAIGLIAWAGTGRLGAMPEPVDDRPGPDLAPGDITAEELRDVRFAVVARGYSMVQVDALLARLADQLEPTLSADPAGEGTSSTSDAG